MKSKGKNVEDSAHKVDTKFGKIVVNKSEYTDAFTGSANPAYAVLCLIRLPHPDSVKFKIPHVQGCGENIIKIEERFNRLFNFGSKDKPANVAYNYYAYDNLFSIKDSSKMPLGQEVYAYVAIQKKRYFPDNSDVVIESLIVNIHVLADQKPSGKRVCRIKEGTPKKGNGSSVAIPGTDRFFTFEPIPESELRDLTRPLREEKILTKRDSFLKTNSAIKKETPS